MSAPHSRDDADALLHVSTIGHLEDLAPKASGLINGVLELPKLFWPYHPQVLYWQNF